MQGLQLAALLRERVWLRAPPTTSQPVRACVPGTRAGPEHPALGAAQGHSPLARGRRCTHVLEGGGPVEVVIQGPPVPRIRRAHAPSGVEAAPDLLRRGGVIARARGRRLPRAFPPSPCMRGAACECTCRSELHAPPCAREQRCPQPAEAPHQLTPGPHLAGQSGHQDLLFQRQPKQAADGHACRAGGRPPRRRQRGLGRGDRLRRELRRGNPEQRGKHGSWSRGRRRRGGRGPGRGRDCRRRAGGARLRGGCMAWPGWAGRSRHWPWSRGWAHQQQHRQPGSHDGADAAVDAARARAATQVPAAGPCAPGTAAAAAAAAATASGALACGVGPSRAIVWRAPRRAVAVCLHCEPAPRGCPLMHGTCQA